MKIRLPFALNAPPSKERVRSVAEGLRVPRLIHQTFSTKDLPPEIESNIDLLKALNPGWVYRLYDDDDIASFIQQEYGSAVWKTFMRITPLYGAAKADLFRYLLLYRIGGVYLDIKSSAKRPLDEVLQPSDRYLLSTWPSQKGDEFEGWGSHPELAAIPAGEFQQWFIVAAPGHPFLKAVIENVLRNLRIYNPAWHGVGKTGVLRVTGPIAYTLAIAPMIRDCSHRFADSRDELGFHYSIYSRGAEHPHRNLFTRHYLDSNDSLLRLNAMERTAARVSYAVRSVTRKIASLRAHL